MGNAEAGRPPAGGGDTDPIEPRAGAGAAIPGRVRRPRHGRGPGHGSETIYRWVCRCQDPPFLLGTYDRDGRVHLKVRDRYWHVVGHVRAICPKCGAEHILDLTPAPDPEPEPWATDSVG